MLLTVAIPTYNRNAVLNDTLRALLPQMTDSCKLVILDNCSDVPVQSTASEVLKSYPQVNYEILRHRYNIGGNANIMRCFEVCDTEWLWILSDDDTINDNSIRMIIETITTNGNCIYINFYASVYGHPKRTHSYYTHGLLDFITRMGYYGNIVYVSAGIFRIDAMGGGIAVGNLYSYSCSPHVAVLISVIGNDGICYMSDFEIAKITSRGRKDAKGSELTYALGIGTLLDMPLAPDVRNELKKRIVEIADVWLNREMVFNHCLLLALATGNKSTYCQLFDQVKYRVFLLDHRLKKRVITYACSLMLRMPHLSYRLAKIGYRILRRVQFPDDLIVNMGL